jgi:DNA polymerase I-like protein with 3'-5' exonuclease and polymerase domains|nr:MAG TPA_asm: DNA POLYMERASE [Caudoviricetes sp.]
MSGFSFGNIKVSSKKQILDLKLYDNPLLVDKSDVPTKYDFVPVILTDEMYEDFALKAIETFLIRLGLRKYKIISAINCKVDDKVVKAEGKIKFYKNNRSKFYDYIPKYSPIITVGAALYSLILEDDIYPAYTQQLFFGKSNFWFSEDLTTEKGHWIYPIDSFRDIFARGFKDPVDSYKTKLAQIKISSLVQNGAKPIPRYPKLIKHKIETSEQFIKEFYEPNKDKRGELLAWDLETSGLSFLKDRIGCITLSYNGTEGWYIPWKIIEENDNKLKLREILKNSRQCLANGKFDVKHLWKNEIPEAKIDEDIIALGHSIDETRSNSLKALAYLYSEYGGYERPLDTVKAKLGKGKNISYIDDIPEEILWDYAVMDAIVTRRIYTNLMNCAKELDKKYPNELSSKGIVDYYYERRIPAENMYARIEYRGVYVDKDAIDALREEMHNYLKDLRKQLAESFGVSEDFEWTSNPKLGKLLESKGWEDLGRSKAGDYLVGDFQLTRWKKDHKEAKIITEMKSVQTLLNTFIGDKTSNSVIAEFLGDNDEEGDKGWSKCLVYHPEDNSWRMHPNYRPMFADSGRSKCTNPNMQQVPSHSDWATKVKKCIITPNNDEYYMTTIDYSSLQLRLASIDSRQEDYLREVLRRPNADIHSATGWATLAKGRKFNVTNVHVEQDGKAVDFLGGEVIFTKNRGSILAEELTEEDTLSDEYFK